jgi:hypothetical protein
VSDCADLLMDSEESDDMGISPMRYFRRGGVLSRPVYSGLV